MNKADNQRTRLTKIMLKNAVLERLQEKGDIHKISVKELCEKAGLNRTTFYAHYDTPEDVLREIENEVTQSMQDFVKNVGTEKVSGAKKYIISFLEYIKRNDNVMRVLLLSNSDTEFRNSFMQQSILMFIENIDIEFRGDEEQFIYSFLLNGSMGIITQWIRSDYSANEETVCRLLFALNKGALSSPDIWIR